MSRRARRSLQNLGREAWAERPSVRILVVVANIQMRTLKAEEGKIARFARASKGNRVKILNRDVAADGNVRESGDVGGGLGKSYLFCLTACPPGNDSVGGPECLPRPVVLITASGLQGEQPLVDEQCRQGSRQNGSVTSGKGLALRAGHGGPSPEPVGCRRTARAASAARAGRRVPAGGRTGNGSFWGPSPGVEQPTQNWYGQGESDCLIKTKHCDGPLRMLTQCDFCPVL
ncbi:hypothetical protein L1887_61928 [Cichorium endivia]|nr:hypothetical protein L1887_61928 [Cichorium endivia]